MLAGDGLSVRSMTPDLCTWFGGLAGPSFVPCEATGTFFGGGLDQVEVSFL